jgi:hypothetical protein
MNARFADREITLLTPFGLLRITPVGVRQDLSVCSTGNSVVYPAAWQDIDMQYAPHEQTLKSEYHLAPGADAGLIRLRYDGLGTPRITSDGSLEIGGFVESPPFAYQDTPQREQVPVRYRIDEDGSVGFQLGFYDTSQPLVIDPVMNYSTYFGGSGNTTVTSVAFDGYGNTILAGWTTATDLPTNGARTKSGGSVDAFVAKLNGSGNKIVWCTYLGGSGDDRAFGVAVDTSIDPTSGTPKDNVYVTGWTQSTNFPVTAGAYQLKLSGGRDAFVTELNSTGTTILYSTYLGGSNYDQGNAITVDSTGAAYVTGDTESTNFPWTANVSQPAYGGQQDVFVTKLAPGGKALVFSSYLGGGGIDHGTGIAIDGSFNVYVTGSTYSTNFPTKYPTQAVIGGGEDVFVTELNSTGTALEFSTYIGGSGGTPGLEECGNAVAVDTSGNVYVAGVTSSVNFPVTAGAYQTTPPNHSAGVHGFAWKFNTANVANITKPVPIYSTYIAGTNPDQVNAVAADPAGNAYLVGSTSSPDFPIVRSFQGALLGLTNAFILKLNATGSGLIFGSYLGGSTSDTANGVAVDCRLNVAIGGVSSSGDFPVQNAAQSYSNAALSGFVTRVVPGWYPISFQIVNGVGYFNLDTWHDGGNDGMGWNYTTYYYSPAEADDVAVVGDWNGSGSTKIGIFRPSTSAWYLDLQGTGTIPSNATFTWPGYRVTPLVGDWNGTGYAKVGFYSGGQFTLDGSSGPISTNLSSIGKNLYIPPFYFGQAGNTPVVGNWTGDGITNVGDVQANQPCQANQLCEVWNLGTNTTLVWNPSSYLAITFGTPGATNDTPVTGDWDGSGVDKVGYVSVNGYWTVNLSATTNLGVKNLIFTQFWWGGSGMQFLVGH